MKILITGANGFIGSNLKYFLLKKNYDVYSIYRKKTNHKKDYFYNGNPINLVKLLSKIKPDVVIHLGALFIAEHKIDNIKQLIDSNIVFTNYLLEAMTISGCNKIINTGTSWQNFNNKDYSPTNLYAATKQAAFDILKFYHNTFNISYINLKLFDTYGPNDTREKLFNVLMKYQNSKKTLNMSKGEQKVNLTHVSDVCVAYHLSIKKLIKTKTKVGLEYGVSAKRNIKLKKLVNKFIEFNSLNININWGGRNYRKNEVFSPCSNLRPVPGYEPKISLEKGLKNLF